MKERTSFYFITAFEHKNNGILILAHHDYINVATSYTFSAVILARGYVLVGPRLTVNNKNIIAEIITDL